MPRSIDIIVGITDDFLVAKKDFKEFWIDFAIKKKNISYFAIKGELGNYLKSFRSLSRHYLNSKNYR